MTMPLRHVQENFVPDTMIFKIADATVAAGAMTFPWWRHSLHDWSAIAADFTPIFGVTWLGVQIIARLIEVWRKRR